MTGTYSDMKKAFIVSFEQLPACMLGCYGHQWIETPNFDRLASLSILFDQHFANDLRTTQNSFPWWTGKTIPDVFEAGEQNSASFISHLKTKGVKSSLLVESDSQTGRNAVDRSQADFFEEFDQVETIVGKNGFKVSEEKTPVAQLMQAAIERLPEWMEDSHEQLIWIRSAGVPFSPLAPEFFSTLYLDEVLDQGDTEEENFDEVNLVGDHAEHSLSEEDEPSDYSEPDLDAEDWQELITVVAELFTNPEELSELDGHERQMARAIYAGYVTLLDQWFGRFLDRMLDYAETHSFLLIVTAAKGGNALLGPVRQAENWGLFEEMSHVPLFIYDSRNEQQGNRRQFLSQPADLPVSVSSWFGKPLEKDPSLGNNLLDVILDRMAFPEPIIYAASDQAIALRSTDFYYLRLAINRESFDSEETEMLSDNLTTQLYQKPMDRWDVYELHAQLPEVVAQFSSRLEQSKKR
ncbi:Sulfatase [Gimesia aquarii]|uniref:Sulfatase n=2 Tax=Gimesia aquarii TaxID=2527964 RepID=A0A517X2P7_9PLAN|nr:Sulfatase [Gimesia aquarii]